MLPFLKPKAKGGVTIMSVKLGPKGENMMPEDAQNDVDPGLMAAADSLIESIKSGDTQSVALALKDAFIICDAMPHEEYEEEEEYE